MTDEQPRQERPDRRGNRRFGDRKNDSSRGGKGQPYRGGGRKRHDGEETQGRWRKDDRGDRRERQDRGERDGKPRQSDRGGRGRGLSRKQEERIQRRGDQRSANREDRGPSPDIDPDVTGKELNRVVLKQLGSMDERNLSWVSKHLVMAGRLLDVDPELAFSHALAASRRGGRHAAVREAVGLTAYAAGHYHDALREFRTYRRISGDQSHLPLMAACEAALGRPEKALELYESVEAEKLEPEGKADMAIIVSGVYSDQGELDKAKEVLEIPQLNLNRAFSFSPRLFRAYGEALTELGELSEAEKWFNQANVADEALGTGEFAPPEIIDLGEGLDEEDDAPRPRVKDVLEEQPDDRD